MNTESSDYHASPFTSQSYPSHRSKIAVHISVLHLVNE